MLSADQAYLLYQTYCPNAFIPEVLETIQESEEMVSSCEGLWDSPTMRPLVRRAGLWLQRYRAIRRGWALAYPPLIRAALARAVLDVAEELLVERGLPFSARTPSFIFTGRAADQSGISRRTLQELFAEAKVRKVLHPQDGYAWVLRDAELALAEAGWVWMERGVPKRNPKKGVSQPIQLIGGRHYGAPLAPTFMAPDPKLEKHLKTLAGSGVRQFEEHPSCLRVLWDMVAEGVLAPRTPPNNRVFTQALLRQQGRRAARGTVLALDWQVRWHGSNKGWELMSDHPRKPVLFVSKSERADLKRRLKVWSPSLEEELLYLRL